MKDLDNFDKGILRLLQQNNRLTTQELGEKLNLSQSAVQRRISRLRKEKIIEAEIAIVSSSALGVGITTVVDVILHEGSSAKIDEFKADMKACPEVFQCYYVTGSYDFVLIVQTRDMTHFEQFSKQYLMDNKNLKHFYTHVVMDTTKISYGFPI
ncbi:Lrp/AsnC family transcriptional regulator [Sinomicrobium pectinilyticum]|uniref:Lrp/AsnC family transcriptional regulator n=1 Tax=Sinomicrobium pectinilyticum TaxID=1084421 RepID=A0A3N0F356_SINP1|nr:Lrp/AsnC family transcriptional regulator [Sinomicrobium pectinilyticum]RNL94536.1 Lrp/AsnC family transcriptional regulator [Sinomicrobium pectinilyticum]